LASGVDSRRTHTDIEQQPDHGRGVIEVRGRQLDRADFTENAGLDQRQLRGMRWQYWVLLGHLHQTAVADLRPQPAQPGHIGSRRRLGQHRDASGN